MAESATSKFNMESVKQELDEHGVAVVPGVIPPHICDEYIAELKTWLGKFGEGGFPDNINSIIHKYGIAHHPVAWKVRHHVRPVFEELWGTQKLLTSLDGIAIGQPPEDYGTGFQVDGQETFHHDQGPHREGLHCYQGAVYLEEAEEEDWCFQVLDSSHKHFHDFFQCVTASSRSEFRRISQRERNWLEEAGCMKRRVPGPKGGIVLWDSRTVHAGAQPIFGRNNMGRWRFICFVCMAPAAWADAEDLKKKVDGYNKIQCSNHWPTSSIKFFNSGRITDRHITSLPPEAQTPEALQLVGAQTYDFDDGRPNGPPKPKTVAVEPVKTATSGPRRQRRQRTAKTSRH